MIGIPKPVYLKPIVIVIERVVYLGQSRVCFRESNQEITSCSTIIQRGIRGKTIIKFVSILQLNKPLSKIILVMFIQIICVRISRKIAVSDNGRSQRQP